MKKITALYTSSLELYQKHKKIFLWVSGILWLFLIVILFSFFYKWVSPSFQVSSANFDLGIKKLPYNVRTIDITFSTNIWVESVSKDIFKITPEVPWVLSLSAPNTLSYKMDESLRIGQDYTIQISKNLLSEKNTWLENDIVYIVSAVAGARVTKILPEEKLEDLSKNMAVFFNIPQISLSSLQDKNNLPCPIAITPKVDGKCSWTTTSVLEFIPKISFAGATKYDYSIISSGMNYPLEWTLTGSFVTPNLEVSISDTFLPKDSIKLTFNYPVSLSEIEKKLSVYSPDLEKKETSNWVKMNVIVEPVLLSENQFLIKPKVGAFYYNTQYKIDIEKWLLPKYGNIPLQEDISKTITATSLLSDIQNFQNMYSQTGALVDTQNIYISDGEYAFHYLPVKNIFFNISFYEEVALDKNLFSFQKIWNSSKNVDFKISYVQEENDKKEVVENKTKIRLELSQNLDTASEYQLKISKIANKNLLDDIIMPYKTAPELKIQGYTFVDYSKSCLYLNNRLPYDLENTAFTFSQSWVVKNVSLGEYIHDWEFERSLEELSFEEKNTKLTQAGYCPSAPEWQFLYAIQTRLNPETKYNFSISALEDLYGTSLKTPFQKEIKTGKIRESDKYVYTQFNNFTNVFPTNVPMVVNIQTIHTDAVYVDVCEMSYDDYVVFLKNPYWNFSSCLKKTSKQLPVKNHLWNLSYNKFDLEKDILWYKSSAYFIGFEIFTDASKTKPVSYDTNNYLKNMIVRTNMGLVLEKASNTSLLFATDLEKHTEIDKLNLEFYDYDFKKTTIKYTFDAKKKVYVIDSDLSWVSYITAKKDDYYGFIAWEDFFSNYDFKYVSGMDSSQKKYAYVYTDRPIYRPGDEIFIKGLLREFHFDGYKKSSYASGTLVLIDENWENYRSIEVTIDANSNFSGSFVIPKDSKLGNFRFEFKPKTGYEYIYTNGFFSIEEYKKPTFKVDIESPKNDVLLWEKVSFQIAPKYYFWGKLVSSQWKYSILSQKYFFDAKDYADYQFGDGNAYFDCMYWGYCNYSDALYGWVSEFKINENGEHSFEYSFSSDKNDAEKLYTFNFDIEDPDTKKTVSNSVSKVLHTTDAYVWVKAHYYNDQKKGIDFELVTLDFDAKPLPYKNIKVELIKKDYKQVKKLWVDGVFYNEYAEENIIEKTFSLISDEKWYVKHNIVSKNSWEYDIKVSYTGKNNQTFSSTSRVYVAWDDYISWRNDNNSVTELEAEKITYALWETAVFTLKSPVDNGKALFVLEKDDGILDYFVHDITSFGDKIEIPLTEKYYPNIYIKAFLIGSQKDNPLPVYKRALWVVKVLSDYKKLNISLLTDKKNYKPGEKMQVTIEVLDKNGKVVPNANGSLSIVDESVLALKGNPRKNPYSFFYDMKRYLWVETLSNLRYLVDKLEVKDTSDGEKWWAWDGVKWWDTKKLRWNFKDTAFWLSDFTTGTDGKAQISIPVMPDNLTTWVLEALVTTPEDNKVWITYETVMTTTPVMIEDNLPRFLSTWDSITFSPVVYNRTGKDMEFKVDLEASGGNLKSIAKTVFIKNWESQKVDFLFDVKSASEWKNFDIAQIKVRAQSKNQWDLSDGIIKNIPIYDTSTIETVSTVGKTSNLSFDEKIDTSSVLKNTLKISVNYWATLLSYLLDGMEYVASFPYGCSEQKTSALMPHIYLKKLYESAWVSYDLKTKTIKKYVDTQVWYKDISVDEAIKDYISEIGKFQNRDGGFMYWYDTTYKVSDTQLSVYLLSSFSQLEQVWYQINQKMMTELKSYLKNQFTQKSICSDTISQNCMALDTKVFILWALYDADPKDGEIYKMYSTLPTEKLSKLVHLDLISKLLSIPTLGVTQKDTLEKKAITFTNEIISNELVFNPRWAFLSNSNTAWRLQNTAKFLEIIARMGSEKISDIESVSDNMLRFISSSKMNNGFGSTLDNANIIQSLAYYVEKTQNISQTSLMGRIHLNGKEIKAQKIDTKNVFEIFSTDLENKDIASLNTLNFEVNGSGSLYYDIQMSYHIPSKNISASDEWFFVDKKYYLFQEYKKIQSLKDEEYKKYLNWEITLHELKYPREVVDYLVPIQKAKVWELVLVYNTVVTNETRDQVAFESFIPAGSEIVNTNLATETQTVTDIATNFSLDRKEFRDERYFAWKSELQPWIYNFSYTIRLTHAWIYQVKPTHVSEFYKPEVFGRSSWNDFRVE